jgi:hypothetical protein
VQWVIAFLKIITEHVLCLAETMQQPVPLSCAGAKGATPRCVCCWCVCCCHCTRGGLLRRAGRARACSAEPEIISIGHVLTCAWLSPAMPCTAPGPDTVSSTPGTPVRNPAAAAA